MKLNLFKNDLFGDSACFWRKIQHFFYADYWFPHVIVALLVFLLGILQIQDINQYSDLFTEPEKTLSRISHVLSFLTLNNIIHNVIGFILVTMSFALLFRSELAWILTLLITLIDLFLDNYFSVNISVGLLIYEVFMVIILYIFKNSFDRTSFAVSTLFAITAIVLTLSFGTIGSYALGQEFKPPINDLFTAFYFTVMTVTTVGYGDILPYTVHARLFTVILVIVGLLIFATALTNFLSPLINNQFMKIIKTRRKKMNRQDHIIIVGNNPLTRNVFKELTARNIPITAIFSQQPEAYTFEDGLPKDYIVGDASNANVLKSVQVDSAWTLLALTDDDSNNAFIIMAAKEINPKIQTVVAANGASNIDKLKRVHPDVILALPVIAAELMAMALNGEDIKADYFMKQLSKLHKK